MSALIGVGKRFGSLFQNSSSPQNEPTAEVYNLSKKIETSYTLENLSSQCELLSKYLDVIRLITVDKRAGDCNRAGDCKYSYELLLRLPLELSSSGKSELNYVEDTADGIVHNYANKSVNGNYTKIYLLTLNEMINRLDTFNGDKDAYDIINAYTYSTEFLKPVGPGATYTISAKPKAGGDPISISNFGQNINPKPRPGGKRKSRRLRKKSKNTKRKSVRTRGRR